MVDDPASMVPIVESPDAISIIVVGGAGTHSSWQPTFGCQTRPVTREITRGSQSDNFGTRARWQPEAYVGVR